MLLKWTFKISNQHLNIFSKENKGLRKFFFPHITMQCQPVALSFQTQTSILVLTSTPGDFLWFEVGNLWSCDILKNFTMELRIVIYSTHKIVLVFPLTEKCPFKVANFYLIEIYNPFSRAPGFQNFLTTKGRWQRRSHEARRSIPDAT